jgi:hypothetical protein
MWFYRNIHESIMLWKLYGFEKHLQKALERGIVLGIAVIQTGKSQNKKIVRHLSS